MTDLPSGEWNDLAYAKLSRVLGAAEANSIMTDTLRRVGLTRLDSADDLHRFATDVSMRGGFVGAVGAMLSLTATLRGATGSAPAT